MLPRELIRKLRRIEILTARTANAQLAGAYHSVFKGIGIAFSEVRQYQPGDDVRRIDWNVTARMRDAYVKLFVEEREITVMLVVDMSGSLDFGSREYSKRDVAAEVAALLAFSAIKNNDRVGLIIFTDRVEMFVPPKKGKKHVLRVITEILTYQPGSRGTDLSAGLDYLGHVANRRSIAFLISDFIPSGESARASRGAAWERSLRIASRRHDLVPITITDPLEQELPSLGFLTAEDPETGLATEFAGWAFGRRNFGKRMQRAKQEREQLFRKLSLDFIEVSTDPARPYLPALLAFFRARAARLHH